MILAVPFVALHYIALLCIGSHKNSNPNLSIPPQPHITKSTPHNNTTHNNTMNTINAANTAKFQKPKFIPKETNDYVLKVGFKETKPAEKLRLETAKHRAGVMMGDPIEAAMFKVMLPAMAAKNIIEVGVFTGYTTLVMAQAAGPGAKVVALDVTDAYPSIGKPFWKEAGVEDRIDLRIAPAKESLQKMLDQGLQGTFDFAFIDADKVGYMDYYELLLQLLRKDGIIAIDNVLWSGKVYDESITDDDTVALRKLAEFVQADDRVEHAMLPFADGITMVRKK